MNNTDLVYKIALGLIPGVGDIRVRKLISHLGSPGAIFREPFRGLIRIPGIGEAAARAILDKRILGKAEDEAAYTESKKIRVLFYLDDDYPVRLKECDDSPVTLYYRGNAGLSEARMLSVVGTRKATARGREICENIISALAGKIPGLVIVSGLAYGIDIIAHKAALSSKLNTIGVLAHGMGTIYPPAHRSTAIEMISQGGLLTDFIHDIPAERNHFLKRNRIIAGISQGLLVVESGVRGGALVTAGMALSYNRDIMAVPGRISDQWSAGCNRLIKRNIAALTENAADVCEVLNWEQPGNTQTTQRSLFNDLGDDEKELLEVIMNDQGLTIDMLSALTGIPLNTLRPVLLNLEIKGLIKCLPGNIYVADGHIG